MDGLCEKLPVADPPGVTDHPIGLRTAPEPLKPASNAAGAIHASSVHVYGQ